jgi:hypothetical protein
LLPQLFNFVVLGSLKLSQFGIKFFFGDFHLVFMQVHHLFSGLFMSELHLGLFTIEVFLHLLDLCLKLADKVPALVFEHLNLSLQVLDSSLIGDFGFLGTVYFLLLFSFCLIKILLQASYLLLQLLDFIIELLNLLLHVAICSLENVIQPLNLGLKPLLLSLEALLVVTDFCL